MADINFPPGFGLQDLVAWGNSGFVVLDRSSNTVIKTPHDDEVAHHIAREQSIYERFAERGGHNGILRYHGAVESRIRLEYASNHNLQSYLSQHDVDVAQKLRWALQIAEAISFVHRSGVFHGDITCHNIFLDDKLDAKLADFAGSSLDGSPFLIAVTPSHRYPGPTLSTKGDLFAFGAVLYTMMNGSPPYDGLSEDEVCSQYSRGMFAETTSLGLLGGIITNCWQGRYSECDVLLEDLRRLPLPFLPNTSEDRKREAQQRKPILYHFDRLISAKSILIPAAIIVTTILGPMLLRLGHRKWGR